MGRCDCHDQKKHCKKCVEKHVIKCLPYHIHKPGHYCLGKDFQYDRTDKSAITIEPSAGQTLDNVVLDFNQRKITTNIQSEISLIKVENVVDIKLNNIHLEAIGEAQDQSFGIEILNSHNVELNSSVLLNLNSFSLYAEGVDGLSISNLFLENLVARSAALYAFDCRNVSYFDSKILNGRSRFSGGVGFHVKNLISQVDSDIVGPSSRWLQFDSASGETSFAKSIIISASNFKSGAEGAVLFLGPVGEEF